MSPLPFIFTFVGGAALVGAKGGYYFYGYGGAIIGGVGFLILSPVLLYLMPERVFLFLDRAFRYLLILSGVIGFTLVVYMLWGVK